MKYENKERVLELFKDIEHTTNLIKTLSGLRAFKMLDGTGSQTIAIFYLYEDTAEPKDQIGKEFYHKYMEFLQQTLDGEKAELATL